ncbi:MAG: hypothetical protein Q4A92_09295 [Corynebacterium sp.]|nr:hypothetical protein [Corynebacterium sp.]
MGRLCRVRNRVLTFAQIEYPVITAKIIRRLLNLNKRLKSKRPQQPTASKECAYERPQRVNGIAAANWAARVPWKENYETS